MSTLAPLLQGFFTDRLIHYFTDRSAKILALTC